MKKALLVSLMLLFSMFAPFDFSGLNFNFAFAEEATPKNSPPVAVDDFYSTAMNMQMTIAAPGVLENDSDPDGNMLLSAKLTDPANGMVVMGTDGRFIYVPKTDFTGTDSFTYTVYDGVDASSIALVTITVGQAAEPQVQKKEETTAPKNSSPVAVDDYYITAVDTQLAVIAPGILSNDNDPDGDFLLVAVSKGPSNGSLSLGTDGSFTYMPNAGFSGIDSFTYSLHDGKEGSSKAVVTITVASAQETNESKEKNKNNEDNNLDKTIKDKDVNESDKEPIILPRTMSVGGSTYNPWADAGLKPYGQYFQNNSEYINPRTGQLIIKSTDFSLPARGLDLVITRIYESPVDSTDDTYAMALFGRGVSLDYPWIGENYLHLEGGQHYLLEWTNNTFEYHKQGTHFILTKNGDNTYTLKRPNGMKYQFDTSKRLTRIEDSNDNYLIFTYYDIYSFHQIDRITDTLGREAVFDYENTKVSSITLSGKTVYYDYDYNDNLLTKVTDPMGRETNYEYNNDLLIKKITYPTGGFTEYNYEPNLNRSFSAIETQGGGGTWHSANHSKRFSLNVNASSYGLSANVSDVPILVKFESEDDIYWSNRGNDDADDLRIYSGDTECPYEVLRFDSSNNSYILFFKAPIISPSNLTTFKIYTDYSSSGDFDNPESVWANAKAIYHFEGDPKDTLGDFNGSISGQLSNSLDCGKIGAGYNFGEQSPLPLISFSPTMTLSPPYTVLFWGIQNEAVYGSQIALSYSGDASFLGLIFKDGISHRTTSSVNAACADIGTNCNMYNMYLTKRTGNGNNCVFQANGNNQVDADYVGTMANNWLFNEISGGFGGWVGYLDEVWIFTDIKSEDWVKVVYNNIGNTNRVTSQKIYESVGNLSSENTFAYTVSNGMITKTDTITKDGQGSTKSTTTLDFAEDGTTTSKTVKDASGTQLFKAGYIYNANLETTQENVYRGDTSTVTYTKKYNYDNWGNLVYYEDPMVNRYYYSFINTNYEYSFRDFSGSTVSGFSNEFYSENPTVSDEIHSLICGKAFDNNSTKIESYYKYDSKGNLTNSKNKHNSGWINIANSYDSYGNITSTTDPLNHTINFEYDDDYNSAYLTRTYVSVGGITLQTTYDYDFSTGNIIMQTDGENYSNYYTYDALGRITELEYPDTKTKTAVYDDDNNIVTTYDEKNHYVKQYFDGLGRKIRAETYMNSSLYQTSTSTYNYLGLVSDTTDPLDRTTLFTYDALGRITSTTLPDGNSSSRDYNDSTNTLLVTYENGNEKKLFYDDLGRLFRIEEYPESGTTYTTNYYYDDFSNLTQKVLQNGYTESYIYDDLGRLTRTNYPDSTYEEITYDDAGNIISTRDRKANVVTYTYDELSRLVRKSNSDSTSVKYTYDKRSLLTKEEANFSAIGGSGGGGGGKHENELNAINSNNNFVNSSTLNLGRLDSLSPINSTHNTQILDRNAQSQEIQDKGQTSKSDVNYTTRAYKFSDKLSVDKEVVPMRTEASKTFDNGDGTCTSVFHGKPIHYKDEKGRWDEIDARIYVEKGKYKMGRNRVDINFANNNLYSISNGSSNISFVPIKVRINDESIPIEMTKISWNLTDEYHLEGKIAENIYLWMQSHEVFVRHAIKTDRKVNDFEAVYLVSVSGYNKENNKSESKDGKRYYLPDENGNLYLKDSDGNVIRIPQPSMWNDENSSSAIAHELWEENGKLYYRKYATEEGKKWLSKQNGALFLDASITYYSSNYDGTTMVIYNEDTWGNIIGYSEADASDQCSSQYYFATASDDGDGYYSLDRSHFTFDTSGLPDGAQISSASLGLYVTSSCNAFSLSVQKGTHADDWVQTDWFNDFTGNYYGTVAVASGQYNTISFNSTGQSDISKTGKTYLCVRDYTHDYSNVVPDDSFYEAYGYFSENSGTDYDPKLIVTYTTFNPPGKPVVTSVDGTIKPPEGKGYNVSDPDGEDLKHRWRIKDDNNATIFNSGWFDNYNDINGTEFTGLTLGNKYNAYLDSNDSQLITISDVYRFKYAGGIPSKSIITKIGGQEKNNSKVTVNPPSAYGFNASDPDGDNLKHRWRVIEGTGLVTPLGLESEEYKRSISISNNSSALANYQIKISLNNSNFNFSKADTNGDDLRFSDDDNSTILNHWIEKWDSINQQATIWVKIPSIPNGNSTLFMYYGSKTLLNSSNGIDTFVFFDDFNGTSLDSKWNVSIPGSIGVSSGYAYPKSYGTGSSWHGPEVTTTLSENLSDFTIDIRFYWDHELTYDLGYTQQGVADSTSNKKHYWYTCDSHASYDESAHYFYADGSAVLIECSSYGADCVSDGWHLHEIVKTGSTIKTYYDGELKYSGTASATNLNKVFFNFYKYSTYNPVTLKVDRILIRNYSSNDPTVSIGNENEKPVLFNSGWFDNYNDINGTELTGLSIGKTYSSYLDVNDSANIVKSDEFVFKLESIPSGCTGPFDTSITYAYDSRGRLTSETSDINGSTYTTSYSYDDASNITSITYPSTNSYGYTYDDVNRITALTGYADFTYTDTNMIHTIEYANGITTSYTYDVRDRPTNIAIENLETLNYTYDPSGNILSMNDWEYEYDGLNRLEAATSVFDLDYTYDALGNRTQQTENTVTTSYTYINMMRLNSKTVAGQATDFTYDSNGNLTEKEEGNSSYTYTWDINSRLREVREDGNLLFEYLYDSHGRRVMSHNHSTGVTTTYIYAGINVIHEVTSTESIDYLYANGMRIAKKTGATVKYFHLDHLGSTRLVTDSSGQPTFESDYKPFGQDANATGTEKYAFTGQYSEADIGLYYFGARWYDASLGRFISEDPIKGSMLSSQSQNPYVYCMNNPLRYIDPSGLMTHVTIEGGGQEVDAWWDNGGTGAYGTIDSEGTFTPFSCNTSTTSTNDNAITGEDVQKTVTSYNFLKNRNWFGNGSPVNKPGTNSYWAPMGNPSYYNPVRYGRPADAIIIGVEGSGSGGIYGGEGGWAIVIGNQGIQRYVYAGGGKAFSSIPGSTSATGKLFFGSVDYGEGVTTLDGPSISTSMTGVVPVAGIVGVGGDITYSVSPNGTTVFTMGGAAGTSGGTVMITGQYWTRYEPTPDNSPIGYHM